MLKATLPNAVVSGIGVFETCGAGRVLQAKAKMLFATKSVHLKTRAPLRPRYLRFVSRAKRFFSFLFRKRGHFSFIPLHFLMRKRAYVRG